MSFTRDGLVFLLIEPIRESGSGWLVHQSQHLQPCDLAGVLGGLSLGIVEVRRHGDHGLAHLGPEIVLGCRLELLQDHRRNLGRRVLLALGLAELHVGPVRTRAYVDVFAGLGMLADRLLELGPRLDELQRLVDGQLVDEQVDGNRRPPFVVPFDLDEPVPDRSDLPVEARGAHAGEASARAAVGEEEGQTRPRRGTKPAPWW